MWGHLTEKVDVFGFGVVALEIISGRPNSDLSLEDEQIYLLGWAWKLHEANRELELVDEELSEFDESELKRVMRVALLCTQTSSTQRPSMSRVVAMLSGDLEVSGVINRPEYLTFFEFDDSTTFESATQTSILSSSSPLDSSPMLHTIIRLNADVILMEDVIVRKFSLWGGEKNASSDMPIFSSFVFQWHVPVVL
ncbi:hypothetical protein L2E82_22779 [Cichorium intybus]|uniref:Uncharacterized protein n=1 Tax=Cichorium intybus TaxID=13427 RepID=A0ACB9DYA7_CICIN|nr:hypothetical protein L2E82_22779 [Cichorium intybus]